MITKERIALFLGGVMLIESLETSFYGGNFYVASLLLIVGALCLICGFTINQQRYDVRPVLEKELQSLNREMAALKTIIENSPKQEDAVSIIEGISALADLSRASGKSLEQLMPFTEGEISKINHEIITLKAIMEDTPRRNDLKKLTEEISAFSGLPTAIESSLNKFLLETKKLNDMAHEGHEKILVDTRKNNEELIEACRDIIDAAVSNIRQDLSKVVVDADILKNDYLRSNSDLIEKQSRIAEDISKNIASISQDTESKMNAILTKIQEFGEDTGEQLSALSKELNESVKELCDNVGESIEDLDDGIRKKHATLVDKLSDDVESMSQNINALAESYSDFKMHSESLVKVFAKMSEEDAKIIKSILPK